MKNKLSLLNSFGIKAILLPLIFFSMDSIFGQTTKTFNYTGSVQTFQVPYGVTSVTIEALGAAGGWTSSNGKPGGTGASMKGTFSVIGGQTLSIYVGQQGFDATHVSSGGAGSGVTIENNLLLIAGGGAGIDASNPVRGNAHASITTSGNSGTGNNNSNFGAGGTLGSKGGDNSSSAGSGISRGGNGWVVGNTGSTGLIGISPGSVNTVTAGTWGLGGGGGSVGDAAYSDGGGGGGGYSGGGGGSFNSGTNQVNTAEANYNAHGKVLITYVPVCKINHPLAKTPNTLYTATISETDAKGWTCYCDDLGQLLLSLQIGTSGAVILPGDLQLKLGEANTLATTSTGNMVTNPNDYVIFDRRWHVIPTTAPDPTKPPVGVRYFYSTVDFDSIRDRLDNFINPSSITSPASLNFYKTSSPIAFIAPHLSQGVIFNNSTVASTTTWKDSSVSALPHIPLQPNTTTLIAQFLVTGFSGGGGGFGGGGAPLPIQFLSFVAKTSVNNTAELNWEMAKQEDYAIYQVQKSSNGRIWSTLDNIETQNSVNYNYKDLTAAQSGMGNYYRIAVISGNGTITYSNLQYVKFDGDGSGITISPNPVKTNLFIENLNPTEVTTFNVMDLSGKVLAT
jgi:hypothetical protein